MEFKDVVYGRRCVRKYQDRKIDDDILKEIIDAALWAPSGVNIQPWYFVVIRSQEKMAELLSDMKIISENNKAHLEERFGAHPEVVKSTMNFIADLGGAPVAVLAFRDKPDYSYALMDNGVVQSVAAAMQNLLLSAYDHGVYGCWMTSPLQAHMEKAFRDKYAPGHGELVCMSVLGYPQSVPAAPKRKENKYVMI